ncbi:cytochrome p450 [Trichoderma arundinaceum]|uniref:Cytochrome p450 n=1 Tax=Trichoderma arundinaceum TaxID=490622 RepID=A0A395NS61_TRIAR|nr:cytochrome p450 [Trichoderma arundinaceum]
MSEEFLAPILGPNVIATANGAIWKRLHNAMAPAFSWSNIRNLTTVLVDEISLFRDGLDKYAKTGEVFSAEELSAKLIFDVIGRVVFNFRLHAQTTPSPYLRDLREMLELAHGQTDLIASYNPIARVTTWWRRRKVLGRLHALILGKFIIMLLSKAPNARDKLRQEHNDVFGKDLNDTIKSLLNAPERLQDLPYTEAVIKETLRLFPVGFGIREAPAGSQVTFQEKTFAIDGHQAIALNAHDVHYNTEFFPDTCIFLPERWLDTNGGVPRSHFRSFGRGKRACLGQPLAMNELKVIMVMLMRDYEFECAGLKPNSKPRVSHTNLDTIYGDIIFQELGIEARPRGGMMMTVKKLKDEISYDVSI